MWLDPDSRVGRPRAPKPSRWAGLLPPEAWPQRVSRLLAWLAGAIVLVGCAGAITVDVITRAVFNRGMVDSFEISGYALAACVGLGLGFSVTTKANIRVDFLVRNLPWRLRIGFDLLASLGLALLAGALAWFAWGTLAQSWTMGARSISQLQMPMVIPQGIWWVGLVWFATVAVLAPAQAVVRLARGDRAGAEAAIGSADLETEIGLAGVERKGPAR